MSFLVENPKKDSFLRENEIRLFPKNNPEFKLLWVNALIDKIL